MSSEWGSRERAALDRWITGGGGPDDSAQICEHCGDEHADETEEDRCAQIHEGECWCDECGKELALERAKADQWMCEACEKEWADVE